MATTNTVTKSYAGEFAGEIISPALFKATTIDNGLITIKPNVKYKTILKRLSTGSLLGADGCDFEAGSSIVLDERELEVKMLKVNLQVCKSDFEDDYLALTQGDSAHNDLPKTFADHLIAEVSKKVSTEMEVAIWQGDGTANTIEGFEAKFLADATVVDVAASAIDATNVIAELGKVVNAISTEILTADDLYLYVSTSIARAYIQALGGFAATGANGFEAKGTQWYNGQALSFGGVKMVVANGLSQGKMVAATKSNLYFGTSLLSDQNEVKTIDMSPIDGSRNVRFVMRMSAGVQYSFGAEVVYYN
tara:strand:+ start:2885 stop:3802 length:918 start_codon:yes stop_codon:yes gene_type:complete